MKFRPAEFVLAALLAWGLTFVFWGSLYLGHGLIGGDVYSYSLPQKVFLADQLAQGRVPLWNPLVGLGYPVLGESQTAVLYPLNLLFFGVLDVQTAWNAVLIAHYVLAFLATWWCSRWLGLDAAGSLLAALVYVYGWFPPRAFLDWAILGGLYLPLSLGCLAACLETRRAAYAVGLSLAIGMQLLGGHYQLAFLTWWLLAGYGSWWAWSHRHEPAFARTSLVAGSAFLTGVMLASVQLLPTWELKLRSQRADVGADHDPAYGHIPPIYISQMALPWVWYDPSLNLDEALGKLTYLSLPAGTNRVEAHLYVGQLPLYLVIIGVIVGWRRRTLRRDQGLWLLVIVLSLIYAVGWLMPLARVVPGFNFFRGPGRAGILTTLAFGLLAGWQLDNLVRRKSGPFRRLVVGMVLLVTAADLYWSPQAVSYAVSIPNPPIRSREESPVYRWAQEQKEPVRLYAPGANLPTVLNVSAVPVYMGLGPQEYFDSRLTMPTRPGDDFHTYREDRVAWLRSAGVTHLLSFQELEPLGWPVEPVWSGFDPLLNRAWSRFDEPIWLYRLQGAPGRYGWDARPSGTSAIRLVSQSPHQIHLQVETEQEATFILRELNYPGWDAWVNGVRAESETVAGLHRGVRLKPGKSEVIWRYRPGSVYWGICLSGLAVFCLFLGPVTLARLPVKQ